MHYTQEPGTVDPADRRAFIEANAVALVEAGEAKIARQRAELRRLGGGRRHVQLHNQRLRRALLAIHTETMEALRAGQHNVRVLWDIEARARAVLLAVGVPVED